MADAHPRTFCLIVRNADLSPHCEKTLDFEISDDYSVFIPDGNMTYTHYQEESV